jgi:glycosyltransferase involved in cell wall biosynthesis
MRILQLGKFYPPVRGGMETVLRHMCEGLLDRGHEVLALVAASGRRGGREEIVSRRTGRGGVLVRCGTVAVVASQPLCPGLPRSLWRGLRDFAPDVVQLHLPHPVACALALALLKLRPGARLAVWYHADITRQRLVGRLLWPLLRSCLQRADGVAVSSQALADGSPVLTSSSCRPRVIPFGIDPAEWHSRTGVPSQGQPVGDPDRPFLFVGRLVYYKGLEPLLAALQRVDAARLVIVGEGPLRGRLAREIDRRKLAGRVRLAGELEEEEMRQAMAHARALILPSTLPSETFGVVQLEAMAAGLPVISTRLPTGVAEVNEDGRTGRLVAPGDSASLAAAMRELIERPDLGQAWGEAGRRRVSDLFHRDAMATALESWYGELLASPRGGRPRVHQRTIGE